MSDVNFDLDAFLKEVKEQTASKKKNSNRLNKVIMSKAEYAGTLTYIPFLAKSVGSFYLALPGVREFNTYTSVIDRDDPVWYKVLAKEAYGELTSTQSELYDQVTGLWDQLSEKDEIQYDELRKRNYSIFLGIPTELINQDNQNVQDFPIGQACMFIYPQLKFIDTFNAAITDRLNSLKDKASIFMNKILNPSRANRKGVAHILCKRADIGYDCSVTFDVNNEYCTFTDENKEYPEEVARLFDDPIKSFLGWSYDYENECYFNETVFRELRDALENRLKELSAEDTDSPEQKPENKNAVDPMRPPIPGEDITTSKRPW